MPSLPWRFFCILLFFKGFGPEITYETIYRLSEALSSEYCKNETDKTRCIAEQFKTLVVLANETYHAYVTNIATYINEIGIIQTIKEYFNFKKDSPPNEKPRSNIFEEPTLGKEDKVNVTNAMSEMLNQMQEEHKKAFPGNSASEVKNRLNTIAGSYGSSAFCTVDNGVNPSVVLDHIQNAASITNMPNELRKTLEGKVQVKDAGSGMVQNTSFPHDGKMHYVLIAVHRNANNSFDVGLAVYYVYYKIAPKGYQEDADQKTLKELMRFLKTDTDEAQGQMTLQGTEDLNAYFFGEAYNMFMYKCPAVLTGFKKVHKESNAIN